MQAAELRGESGLRWFVSRLALAFTDPQDPEDVRLRKTTLVVANLMFVPAGIVWGTVYFALGDVRSGLIPFGYGLVCALSLGYFYWTRRYEFFRDSQLFLVLVLPVLLMVSLGGYIPSSAVILWSFLSPMGALLFIGRRQAWRWLLLYLLTLVATGVLDRGLNAASALPNRVIILFFVLNLAAVSLIVFVLLTYFDSEKDRVHDLLQAEQATTERLLLNVLPAQVVPDLKAGRTAAHQFESASILFADIVGFTSLSGQLSAEAMVDLLNRVFSEFDSLVANHEVEKIRTIGDNYMVVSGVPTPRADHAQALADLALEMCATLEQRPWDPVVNLEFRLGMSSGPVVGAVIGQSKFHYDVWGQAVNLASRMESHGVPGRIQIDGQAHDLLKEDFTCERRGVIEVKGFGPTETWFLTGRG